LIRDEGSEDLHLFETPDEAFQYLRYVGTLKDNEIDLGESGLALALIFMPGINPERYRYHLKKLREQLAEEMQLRLRAGPEDTLALRISALKKVMHESAGYRGDAENYDDIQNMNLIRVIERRRGLPVSLGLLYVFLGTSLGWQIDGLNFPGHFLVRLEKDGERVILDPFREGQEMDAPALRQLLKSVVGQKAELSHNYYEPVIRRDMLIRLENNLKKRLIDGEEYAQAVIVLEAMEALAPDDYRVLFDKGILYAKLSQPQQAMAALERYIEKTPNPREKTEARAILQQIKSLH
jgi:regulator of sirC expression with transglutaminase-like and TPR domain